MSQSMALLRPLMAITHAKSGLNFIYYNLGMEYAQVDESIGEF
jgi:hypothetical protein